MDRTAPTRGVAPVRSTGNAPLLAPTLGPTMPPPANPGLLLPKAAPAQQAMMTGCGPMTGCVPPGGLITVTREATRAGMGALVEALD